MRSNLSGNENPSIVANAWSRTGISKKAQQRFVLGLTALGLIIMTVGSMTLVMLSLKAVSTANLNSTFFAITLCLSAVAFGCALLAERRLASRRSCVPLQQSEPQRTDEAINDELASLLELDALIDEQEPYFGLQLAIALRDKARHFPIRVTDIHELREVLEATNDQTNEPENPQIGHLSKIISRLEGRYAK